MTPPSNESNHVLTRASREQLKAQILAAVRAHRSPTRAQTRLRLLLALLCALALLFVIASREGLRVVGARPWLYNLALASTFGSVLAVLLRPLSSFARTPLGPPRSLLRARVRLALPALVLGTLLANVIAPETVQPPARTLWNYVPCILLATGSAAFLCALALTWLRGADPLAPSWTARALGVVSGAAASFAASVPCPHVDPVHMLVSHVAPVGLALWISGALGASVLRVRWPARSPLQTSLADDQPPAREE